MTFLFILHMRVW